jgi:hypothetical protein
MNMAKEQTPAPTLTTNPGAAVEDNQNSITARPRGPVLLHDYWLLEKSATFNWFSELTKGAMVRAAVLLIVPATSSMEFAACSDLAGKGGTHPIVNYHNAVVGGHQTGDNVTISPSPRL